MIQIISHSLLILTVNISCFFVNADFVYSGNVNEDLNFEYGEETEVHNGCGALLRNVFWYFGGSGSNKRQVRLLKDLNIYLFSGE